MKIAALAEVKVRFSAYIDVSRDTATVVTRNGQPVAMIIAIQDEEEDDLDSLLPAHDPRFQTPLDEAREPFLLTGGVPLADLQCRTSGASD